MELKVIRLIEPDLCMECRFAQKAVVGMKGGGEQIMIHCLRRDCDNWDYTDVDDAETLTVDSDRAD